jgi:pyruvate dehydrogenase (quinone)
MAKTVAEIFIETLVNAGVKRVYGVVGDLPERVNRGHP